MAANAVETYTNQSHRATEPQSHTGIVVALEHTEALRANKGTEALRTNKGTEDKQRHCL